MPNIGYTTAGTTGTTSVENQIVGSAFTTPAGGPFTIDSITAYINPSATQFTTKCAIYTAAHALVANSATDVVTGTSGAGWRTFPYSGTKPVLDGSTAYIIVAWSQSRSGTDLISYDTGSANQGHLQTSTYGTSFPSTITPTSHNTNQYSIYATCGNITLTLGSVQAAAQTTAPTAEGTSPNVSLTLGSVQAAAQTTAPTAAGTGGLEIDASTPAAVSGQFNGVTLDTASFTPPAGSTLYILGCYNDAVETGKTCTITGQSGQTVPEGHHSYGGASWLWTYRDCAAVATTVSIGGATNGGDHGLLRVLVVTGADNSSPVANVTSANEAWGGFSLQYTSTRNGSWGWMIYADWVAAGLPTVTGCSTDASWHGNGLDSYAAIKQNSATATSGSTVTFAVTTPDSGTSITCAPLVFEMMPATAASPDVTVTLGSVQAAGQTSAPPGKGTASLTLGSVQAQAQTTVPATGATASVSLGSVQALGQTTTPGEIATASLTLGSVQALGQIESAAIQGTALFTLASVQAAAQSTAPGLTTTINQAVTGTQAAGQVGQPSLSATAELHPAGVEGQAQAGSLNATGAAVQAVPGVETQGLTSALATSGTAALGLGSTQALGQVGNPEVSTSTIVNASVDLDSVAATGQLGSLAWITTVDVAAVGVQAGGQVGTAAAYSNFTASIAGIQAASGQTAPSVQAGAVAALTGVSTPAGLGALSEAGTASVALLGISSASEVGVLPVAGAASQPLESVAATGQTGTLSESGTALVGLAGLEAGGLTADVEAIGTTVGSANVSLTGLAASAAAGQPDAAGTVSPAITGSVQVTASIFGGDTIPAGFGEPDSGWAELPGGPLYTPAATVAVDLVGTQAAGWCGTLAESGTAVQQAVGVGGTAQVGTLAVATQAVAALAGVAATAEAGSPIGSTLADAVVMLDSVQATATLGSPAVFPTSNTLLVGAQAAGQVAGLAVIADSSTFLLGVVTHSQAGKLFVEQVAWTPTALTGSWPSLALEGQWAEIGLKASVPVIGLEGRTDGIVLNGHHAPYLDLKGEV